MKADELRKEFKGTEYCKKLRTYLIISEIIFLISIIVEIVLDFTIGLNIIPEFILGLISGIALIIGVYLEGKLDGAFKQYIIDKK